MYQQDYYVTKSSGTLADALLGYGVGRLLRALVQNAPGRNPHGRCPVSIDDQGICYQIHLPEPVQPEWLRESRIPQDLAMPVLRIPKPKDKPTAQIGGTSLTTPDNKKLLPDGLTPINYNSIWDEIRQANMLIEEQSKFGGRLRQQEILDLKESTRKEPHREVALLIGDYRMQVEGIHNQAVRQWYDTSQAGFQEANLRAILQMFASLQSDTKTIVKEWTAAVNLDGIKLRLTASQVYNPSMGKGQNRAKADQLVMSNEENFWLVEYLKAVGLFIAAAPCAFPDEDMRKTYVLAPAHIELANHEAIFGRFERTFAGLSVSPIKADILTSLDYASAYLSYWVEVYKQGSVLAEPNPRNSIHGFYAASYALLSQNSFTTINLAFLGLPPWLSQINSIGDVVTMQEVIEEQRALIRPLQEKYQEGNVLLDAYRDFLTGYRLNGFFDFCSGYGEHVLRGLLENRFIRQCRVQSLDEIFRRVSMPKPGTEPMNDLTEFISTSGAHPGFHRIAYAIRRSTVIPQRQNANYKSGQRAEKSLYEVRYGLGNNLRRKADDPSEFMEELTEFIHQYNAETDQVFENTSEERKRDPENYARTHYRKRIDISDLDDVLGLVNGPRPFSSQLVCNMLVAYGYATTGDSDRSNVGSTGAVSSSTDSGEE